VTDAFHITHLANLESIMQAGGLYCDNLRAAKDLSCTGIAHQHIKDRRAKRVVPTCEGGTLADYVPFYFAPRSPMLYAIATGFVANYADGQSGVVHLRCSVEELAEALDSTYTDGHAEITFSEFFESLGDLGKIDWQIMTAIYWNDTADDGDRKRRRQAEFLVHGFVPWTFVREIGVINPEMATKVQQVIASSAHKPIISVHREWYY